MTTIKIPSSTLVKALNSVASVSPRKTVIPILDGILFRVADNKLSLVGSDLEIIMTIDLELNESVQGEDHSVVLPPGRFIKTLQAIVQQEVTIKFLDDNTATVITSHGRYSIAGWNSEDWPDSSAAVSGKPAPVVEIPGAILQQMISSVRFAVSQDMLRPAMMGILLVLEKGTAVATDGHRLARFTTTELQVGDMPVCILPSKMADLVLKLPADTFYDVWINDSYISVACENTSIMSRLIGDPFPNYQAVIPTDNDKKLTVNADALMAAIKRVGLYASQITGQVRVRLADGRIKLNAEDIASAASAEEEVLCEYDSDELLIGFNANYLHDALVMITTEDACLELTTPTRAAIMKPVNGPANSDLLMLVMPTMLSS